MNRLTPYLLTIDINDKSSSRKQKVGDVDSLRRYSGSRHYNTETLPPYVHHEYGVLLASNKSSYIIFRSVVSPYYFLFIRETAHAVVL